MAAPSAAGSRREQCGQRRDTWVSARFSVAEKAALKEAADRAGLALSAYLGQVGMDAVGGRPASTKQAQRAMLAELIQTGRLIRRAVARLEETGPAGPDLGPAAQYLTQVARHIDEAALRVSRRLL